MQILPIAFGNRSGALDPAFAAFVGGIVLVVVAALALALLLSAAAALGFAAGGFYERFHALRLIRRAS